jgi:hypothetical protein
MKFMGFLGSQGNPFCFSLFSLSGNTKNPKRLDVVLTLFALHPDVPCESAVLATAVVSKTRAIAIFCAHFATVNLELYRVARDNQDVVVYSRHRYEDISNLFNWNSDSDFAEGFRNLGTSRDHHFVVLVFGCSLSVGYYINF